VGYLCGRFILWHGDCEDFVTPELTEVRSLCYARLDHKHPAHL